MEVINVEVEEDYRGDATIGSSQHSPDRTNNLDTDRMIDVTPSNKQGSSTSTLLKYASEFTTTINLILLSYFLWYIWILTVAKGSVNMHLVDYENGLVMGVFICVLLNAAAYPKDEQLGQYIIKNKYRIIRFFFVPFCVSTSSAACSKSNECRFLLPTDAVNLFLLVFLMCAVIIFGRIIHRICINMINDGDNGDNYSKQ